jgi:hypothetical protein
MAKHDNANDGSELRSVLAAMAMLLAASIIMAALIGL